jgi:hypothetical protein
MLQSIEIHLVDPDDTESQMYVAYRGVTALGVPFYVETTALDQRDVVDQVADDLLVNVNEWGVPPDPE